MASVRAREAGRRGNGRLAAKGSARAIGLGAALLALSCAHPAPSAPPARARVEFTSIPDAEAAGVANPHDYQGKPLCQRCHVSGETGPQMDPLALCGKCHDPNRMKHPFGITQAGGAGALPLHGGREVVCHTCHDPHDVKAHPHGLRSDFSALCSNCHKKH